MYYYICRFYYDKTLWLDHPVQAFPVVEANVLWLTKLETWKVVRHCDIIGGGLFREGIRCFL